MSRSLRPLSARDLLPPNTDPGQVGRGLFVVIEGADGSGKTAATQQLLKLLSARGICASRTRRVDPDDRQGPYARLIGAVAGLFEHSGRLGVGFDLLTLAAAAQYTAILYAQVLPALCRGEVIVAENWWAKTWTRLSIEASYHGRLDPERLARLRTWQRSLMPEPVLPPNTQLTILLEAPETDRAAWYLSAGCPEAVYDTDGNSSREPAAFTHLTSEIAKLLRDLAARQHWPIVTNHAGRTPADVAGELSELVLSHPALAGHNRDPQEGAVCERA